MLGCFSFVFESVFFFQVMYKLKILVGFMQIAMKTVQQGQLSWPSHFNSFLQAFTFFNFDFVPWQSIDCFSGFDFLEKSLFVGIMPIALAIVLYLMYFIPMRIADRNDNSDSDKMRHRRLMQNKKFTKIILFTVFLLYPHVSSIILGVYNCIPVLKQ